MDNNKGCANRSIGCDAENCAYNKDGVSCCAEHIRVDGKRAHCTGDTCCITFEEKPKH